ncbi:MAG: serine/threonine protein kinase [Planctomycetota bacterium]|jgi:serine/threonine protein kinase
MDAPRRVPGRAFCPQCGQKYAVPEEELQRHPGLRFRATCRTCSTPFNVRWVEDGLATERDEVQSTIDDGRDVLPKGTRVGKYEIEQMLASGGSSTVYRAFELGANRTVALKVLHKDPDSDYGVRFRREVEVQGNLKHPNLMPIFDQGRIDGKPYYTMELLHKPTTLETIVSLFRDGRLGYAPSLRPLDSIEALLRRVLLPVARAIAFANSNGVLHRDLKPGNVIVDARTLHVYLIDFGICHVFRSSGHRLVLRGGQGEETNEEKKLRAMGTARFMPPEQTHGEMNERGDIWQLGVLLYYVLAGESPIAPAIDLNRVSLEKRVGNLRKIADSSRAAGDEEDAKTYERRIRELESGTTRTMKDVFRDAREGNYRPLPHGTDGALAAIVNKATHMDPRQRYDGAEQFADEVTRYLDGRPVKARVRSLGPGRAAVYNARLLLERNRSLFIAGSIVALLAVAAVLGLVLKGAADKRKTIDAWVKEALDSDDPLVQEDRMARVLGLDPEHAEAQRLLPVARMYAPILDKLRTAREARTRVEELRRAGRLDTAADLAENTAAVLEGSVLPDLMSLPEDYAGRQQVPLARNLADYLRGRRQVKLTAVPAGVTARLVPPRSRRDPALMWDRAEPWGDADERALEPGSYVILFARDGKEVCVPILVTHTTGKRAEVACPIDPAEVPDGMCYIAAARRVIVGDLRFTEESRRVDVGAFWIDRHEVTNAQYAAFLRTPSPDATRDGRAAPPRPRRG